MNEKILTAAQMAACDQHTIDVIGIPSLVLMERAALKTAEVIQEHADGHKILVVCGTGNNGGDGLAVTRLLYLAGYDVTAVLLGNPDKASAQTKTQLKIVNYYEIPVFDKLPNLAEFTMIVDAIFGIGLSRPITGEFAQIITQLNDARAEKFAVDMPSGIHADTGDILGVAFKADITVTMAYKKVGQTQNDGITYAGEVLPVDIGVYQE